MTQRTPEETKERYIRELGEGLGAVFYQLYVEIVWVRSKWKEFETLFGTKPSRIELLNRAAPYFFRVVQDSLWQDALLGLARLTDRPTVGRNENLTLLRLPALIEDDKLKEAIRDQLDVVREKAEFVRDWRNRHIAHRDFPLSMGGDAQPLAAATRESASQLISEIESTLNVISKGVLGSTIAFEMISNPRGAEHLLYVLDDGLRMEEQRHARLKSGDCDSSLDQPRDL